MITTLLEYLPLTVKMFDFGLSLRELQSSLFNFGEVCLNLVLNTSVIPCMYDLSCLMSTCLYPLVINDPSSHTTACEAVYIAAMIEYSTCIT